MTTERQATGSIAPEALEQLFTGARTHNGWLDKEVPDSVLERAVDYAKWGPTSANCSPMRVVFVRSPEAKARLAPAMSDANRPKFREYVVHEHPQSYRYDGDVQVGVVLPRDRVSYYEVPHEYGVTKYRYTVVNDRTVLVDPASGRVVQIVN